MNIKYIILSIVTDFRESFRSRRKITNELPDLIIRLGGIGDVIMTTGLLKGCNEKKTFFLTHHSHQELLSRLDLKNVEFIYLKKQINGVQTKKENFLALFSIWKKLFFRNFDTVYICYQDERYKKLLSFCFYKNIKLLSEKNINEKYLGQTILEKKFFGDFSFPALKIKEEKKNFRRIVLFPGNEKDIIAGKNLRSWPKGNFWKLIKILQENNYEVIISGSLKDGEALNDWKNLDLKFQFSDSLLDTLKLIQSSFCVVTPDSGPMHLSLLAKTYCICLFGPTHPKTRIPECSLNSGKAKVLFFPEKIGCSPCYNGKNYNKCFRPICMEQITPNDVYLKIKEYENSDSS